MQHKKPSLNAMHFKILAFESQVVPTMPMRFIKSTTSNIVKEISM
jgi:hypothetical protein